MKRIRFSFIIIIVMSLLDMACAHKRDGGRLNLSVREIKVDSWLNLMPGGLGTFHVVSEIKIKNEENYKIKNLHLERIIIEKNDKKIYSFTPIFHPKAENDDRFISAESEKDFLFFTESGLAINKELNVNLSVKVLMIFRAENDHQFHYEIENIKVGKV